MEDVEKMRLQGVFDEATEVDDEAWEHIASSLRQRLCFTGRFEKEKLWARFTEIVEGSLIEPITDPTKLLE